MEFEEQDEEIEMHLAQADYVSAAAEAGRRYKYKECLKNHAVGIGGNAVDGCREFMAAGEEGTLDALRCAACNCHRNFHRKQTEQDTMLALQQQQQYQYHRPSGYLVTPMSQQRPLALPASSRELEMDEDHMSNPSSSGGGGSRKRFRTKFTQDQKDKMMELAERLGWRIQQQDEAMVQNFCAETGVQRQVLKVWMHNNKHTLGKQLR